MYKYEGFSGFDAFEDSLPVMSLSPRHTGGPIVKTGPTAGQNRSRNKNGRWRRKRRKRSDANKPRN